MEPDKQAAIGVVIDASKASVGAATAESEMQRVGRAADNMAGNVERSGKSFVGLSTVARAAGAALAGISIAELGKSILSASMDMQKAQVALSLVVGTTQAAGAELDLLRARANQLGVSFQAILPTYSSFMVATRGTALEGDAARKVFDSVSKAVSVMHLNADQAQGVFLALQQMISKGTVSAEELRGQLGERLPGAFGLAAKAVGVTEQQLGKMLEKGELAASELLPKLALELDKAFDPKVAEAADTLQSNLNRLNNSWFELRDAIASSGLSDLANVAARAAADAVSTLADAVRGAGDAAVYLRDGITIVTAAASAFVAVRLVGYMGEVITAVRGLTVAQIALNAAMLANPFAILALAIAAPLAALNTLRNEIQRVTGNFLTLYETGAIVLNKVGSFLGIVKDKGDVTTQSMLAVTARAKELAATKNIPLADAINVLKGRTTMASLEMEKLKASSAAGTAAVVKLGATGSPAVDKVTKASKEAAKALREAAQQAQQFAEFISALDADTASKKALLNGQKLQAEVITEQDKLQRQLNRPLTTAEAATLKTKLKANQDITEALKKQKEAQEAATKATDAAKKKLEEQAKAAAEAANKPFVDAAKRIQETFADTFTNIFTNGIDGFKDFGSQIKGVFARMLGELATLAIKNQVIIPVVTAVAGSLGMGSTGNALGNALGGAVGAGGGGGGLGSLLQGGSSLSNLFGGGATGSSLFSSTGLFGSLTGGATLNGSLAGVLTQFGPTQGIGELLATNGLGGASLGGFGAAAGLGYIGGSALTKILGMKGKYGGVGGSIGATIGMLGGPLGALAGGVVGSLIGGLIGGKKPSDKFAGNFINLGSGSVYGGYSKTGENIANRDALTQATLASRQALMNITGGTFGANSTAQVHVGSRDGIVVSAGGASQRVGVGDYQGAINALTGLMARQLTGIPAELQKAINRIDFSNLEQAYSDLQFASDVINGKLFDTTPVDEYKVALQAINAQFDDYATRATKLGLETAKVESERQEALNAFKAQTLAPITSYLQQLTQTRGGLATPVELLSTAQQSFADLVAKAKNMDQSAIAALPQAGQTLIALQQQFSASGQATVDTIAQVQAALQDILGSAGLSTTGNATVDAINNGNGNVVSALQQLQQIQSDQSQKITELTQQIQALLGNIVNR